MKCLTYYSCFILLITACGDDVAAPSQCLVTVDCPASQICQDGTCIPGADGPRYLPDVYDATPVPDTAEPKDTKLQAPDFSNPDTTPQDVSDKTPPEVKSITPVQGQANVPVGALTVTVTFTKAINIGLTDKTFQLKDINGKEMPGTFLKNATNDVWTFTASETARYACGYTATVNGNAPYFITDFSGNKMQSPTSVTFFTEAPPNMAKYGAVAMKYAPRVRMGTNGSKSHYEYPLAVTFDGNDDLKDNKKNLASTTIKQVEAKTHYSVIESESHYFIHYVWYWPARSNSDENEEFENDSAGALVVVEKWGDQGERPVEVLPWFKKGELEFIRAFPTKESGIFIETEKKQIKHSYDRVYPQAELFEKDVASGAHRFHAWLPAQKHESCLWNDSGSTAVGSVGCKLDAVTRNSVAHVQLNPGMQSQPFIKQPGWPVDGVYDYALVDLVKTWWPRRGQFGEFVYGTGPEEMALYEGYKDADKTIKVHFSTYFVDADGNKSAGRPAWSTKWASQDQGISLTEMPQGTFYFDPASYLKFRHCGTTNPTSCDVPYFATSFDAETSAGYSTKYCFNPYMELDYRGTSKACP